METSRPVRPFAFDRVFEPAAMSTAHAGPDDLRRRIAMLEAELALARDDGESAVALAARAAFDAGLAEARAERDTALLAATDALQAAIEALDTRLDAIADEAARHAAEIAHGAATILAGRALVEMPAAAIDEAIGRALRQVARGQEIMVSVAPELVAEVERLVAVRQGGDRRHLALTVGADAGVRPGDAHIRWDQGGMILDAAARAEAVRAALDAVLSR